jgi:predicted F0F1-ATPase subunit
MTDKPSSSSKGGPTFAEQVGAKAARKLKARRNPSQVWFGLGMMGLVGWSVVIPTLLGAALGLWLDARYAGRHSSQSPNKREIGFGGRRRYCCGRSVESKSRCHFDIRF